MACQIFVRVRLLLPCNLSGIRPCMRIYGYLEMLAEIQNPPTTHMVATVDNLTDMLVFDSEDINGMDTDEGDDEEPAPTRP